MVSESRLVPTTNYYYRDDIVRKVLAVRTSRTIAKYLSTFPIDSVVFRKL